ncbi:MAG: helix-turn-helix domain-containing protein [Bacteroidales bacterium]|nr:helix-turn-helix domain-containing protein [Bacteroidales bacterium]
MITTDIAFTDYLERTIWAKDKPAPPRDELIKMENAFMSRLGALKNQKPQDGSYRYLYSVYGKQLASRIGYLTRMKDEGNDVLAVRSLLSSHARLRDALKAMDQRLFKSELGPILRRNRLEHDKRAREKEATSTPSGTATDNTSAAPTTTPQPPATPPNILSSTQGLADYLGCGRTMAFSIIKSGVLKKDAIQYKVGQCWKFNREKLDKYIADNPEILGKIRCKR